MKSGGERHRRSIRLPGYDYTGAGAYFITICAEDRECVFGHIAEGEMVLNHAGRMVQTVWEELPEFYPGVGIDAFQIMPNHVHGIIILVVGATPCGCPGETTPCGCPNQTGRPQGVAPTGEQSGDLMRKPHWVAGQARGPVSSGQARGPAPTATPTTAAISLPDLVHRFKTMTTKKYADGVKEHHWPPFPGKLWQRNYYERVVRNDDQLQRMRKYVMDNPRRWHLDRENPNHSIRRK